MKTAKFLAPVMVSLSLLALTATAQVGTFQLKSLTPETALKAAQDTLFPFTTLFRSRKSVV